MPKPKKKLTAAQRAAKKRQKQDYKFIFINGKQKRVRREPTIDGVPVDEFIRNNADPIWLLQNGMYEELYALEQEQNREWNLVREREGAREQNPAPDLKAIPDPDTDPDPDDVELPF